MNGSTTFGAQVFTVRYVEAWDTSCHYPICMRIRILSLRSMYILVETLEMYTVNMFRCYIAP
jgi:hypothetical protein